MIKNPIPVALAMLVNSFLSGLVHFLTKWTESLANCFSGSIKTSLNPSFSILIVRCYVYVVAVSLYRKKGNQMLEIAKEPSRKQAKRLRVRHLKRPPISISNEKLPDWTEWKTRQGPFATHEWIWTQTRNATNFSKSRYKDHHVKYPIVAKWTIEPSKRKLLSASSCVGNHRRPGSCAFPLGYFRHHRYRQLHHCRTYSTDKEHCVCDENTIDRWQKQQGKMTDLDRTIGTESYEGRTIPYHVYS